MKVVNFITFATIFYPTLKFILTVSDTYLPLLDLSASISEDVLFTIIYNKTTDSYSCLDYTFSHLASCVDAIAFSEFPICAASVLKIGFLFQVCPPFSGKWLFLHQSWWSPHLHFPHFQDTCSHLPSSRKSGVKFPWSFLFTPLASASIHYFPQLQCDSTISHNFPHCSFLLSAGTILSTNPWSAPSSPCIPPSAQHFPLTV